MSLFTEYSLWFLPLCIVGGLGVALLLYFRNEYTQIFPKHITNIAFALRTVFVSVLLFLLLAPYVQRTKRDILKPLVVVVQDNSQSITMHKDSLYYKNEYLQNFNTLIQKLKSTYTTHVYSFGEYITDTASVDFSQKRTDISNALNDVYARYYNTNLGAIIVASDGLYNNGDNPLYTPVAQLSIPIYTVALGNPNQVCDNLIRDVQHNAIVFRNNPFTVRIQVESHNLQGKHSMVTVFEGTKQVYTTRIQAPSNNYYTYVDCKLQTEKLGQVLYTVKIEQHTDEITYKNNEFLFSVDVLESRQNILLVYQSVHPDVAAIRRAIESNKNYKLTVASIQEFTGNVQDYNCVILHGLPQSFGKSKELVQKTKELLIPTLYIYNSTMNVALLDMLDVGVTIRQTNTSSDEVQARYEKQNSLFDIDAEIKECIETSPPLFVPYGNYLTGIQSHVVLWQSMQNMQLQRPLLVFSNKDGYKTAFLAGEGIWRWRMHAYKKYKSFTAFDVFVNKCINYLALTQKREIFRVQTNPIFTENQDISFRAELYNKSYEPIQNKEIRIRVFNSKGKEFPFTFTSNNDYYALHIGKMPVGTYSYVASTIVDGKTLEQKGTYIVMPLQMEFSQTRANHSVLQSMSQQSGGVLVQKEHIVQLYDSIMAHKDIAPISYTSNNRTLLLDSIWLMLILLLFVSTEWFLRKFYGSY